MSTLFDKLNLRPQERRLVVIVGIVVFVVLNFWLVIPMFGDYGRYEQRIKDAQGKLKSYQDEISKKGSYNTELKTLESQGGFVPTEEAGLRLSTEVSSQAALSGVTITSITQLQRQQSGGKTNTFFDEAAVTINFNTTEKELVDFLWRLADKETLIRAKSMTLGTDPSRMRLQGNITLVKSFQRRPTTKVTAVTAKVPAATKPASTTTAPTTAPAATPAATATPAKTLPAAVPTPAPVKPPVAPVPAPATRPAAGEPAPIPAPTPSGGTNRVRRSMPSPIKPKP